MHSLRKRDDSAGRNGYVLAVRRKGNERSADEVKRVVLRKIEHFMWIRLEV